MTRLPAGIVLLLLLGTSLAAAQIATSEDIERLSRGKKEFEAKCIVCHPLDVTVPRNVEEMGWLAVIEKMLAEGTEVQSDEKERIALYLESKTRFEKVCSTCHPKEQCLSRKKTPEEWTRTVKKMSLLVEGGIAKKHVNKIVSYLSVICPRE
jgi:cytochrome c5